ncbi:hypothetical protein RND71_036707 [Anisodus tanguticus]|uniref:LIM zinc-binding domain-containing protein n=1 Tax=Anisodus tanguticus TaxID=243964 RepID=A0AAE1USZ6_9SOLA|nr:hypothetical protein RND71_036707 [Anisodus tanguticus]
MKWLTKILKRGSCNRGLPRGQQPQLLGDENMVWLPPIRSLDDRSKASKEKEELNRATAVSLTENFRRPGYKCWTDNDEDLGRPLNHDLSSSSYPPYAPSYGPWEYNPRSYRICSGCHGDIGSGNYLGCMGTFFHPECFICRACGYPITEYEHAIRDYYEVMNMKIEQQVPMLLVERQALNEAIEGEKHGFHHMPETRGLCPSEEQTVTSEDFALGLVDLLYLSICRLLTGAILAHELMHAWLCLKGFRNLSLEVEEGICQVLSYMWLESEVMSGSRDMPSTSTASSSSISSSKKGVKSGVENKLGEFFMHQIAHDTSPAYGGGFRAANEAVNKYGLRCTLDYIRLTGSFPL